ncbi:hypothetical protein [Lacimicrobium sp. SS2-24]|uniref:hypothetical protein n=1 Tax=Lacimicrobium sp. SS2-24 TaxID=2005569 RepID=UPI000B4C11E3|nr:hypothetical protein [Lacimicrobium sp. SS2-24]
MDLLDSGNVKNRVKLRSVAVATLIHLSLAAFTLGLSLLLLLIFGTLTASFINRETRHATASSNTFKKHFPFNSYGQVFGSFQHVFVHSKNIEQSMFTAIESELISCTPIKSLERVTITDIDPDLTDIDERHFIKASSTPSARGTALTLILNQSQFGQMQSIEWRVLCGGYIDKNKKFNFVAYSLFSFLFWIQPYIRREYDLLTKIKTIYSSAYNDMDVMTQIRCIHDAVFNAMIKELEKHDIDTSELKAQKMQVMNINVSGGRVNMGNVVQGAMNKVSNMTSGVRK